MTVPAAPEDAAVPTPHRARGGRCPYVLAAGVIFFMEVAIARGLGGPWVRGSVGDIMVIVLMYVCLRAVLPFSPRVVALLAVSTGFLFEGLQAVHVADRLGLRPGSLLYIVIGNTFSVMDLAMYVLGGLVALGFDEGVLMRAGGK